MNPNIPNTNNLQNDLRTFGNNCKINTMGLIQFIGNNSIEITYDFINTITKFTTREQDLCLKVGRIATQKRMEGIDNIIQNSTLTPQVKQQQVINYITSIKGRYWPGQLYRSGGKRKSNKNKRKSHKNRNTKRKSHKKRRTHRK